MRNTGGGQCRPLPPRRCTCAIVLNILDYIYCVHKIFRKVQTHLKFFVHVSVVWISRNCVTTFSSYHSHKPGCPRRPPAQHADTNPPSVIRFWSTLPKLNEIITLTSVLARQCFIFGKCKISRLKWFLKFFKDNNLRQIKKKQGAKHCNKVSLKTAWFNKQILQPVEVLQMDQNTKLPHLKSKTGLSEWLIKTKISKSI